MRPYLRRIHWLTAPALLFLIVACFHWRVTLTKQYDWVWGPDLATQVMPWLDEQARGWHEGIIPLWDPYLHGGQPLIGQAQPGVAYPFNWLLFALPLPGGHINWTAMQWYFVLPRFMAALFCYWLCRDLGRSRAASVLGGVVFAFCGYMASTGWPQMVNGAIWLPLVFLFLLRAARGRNTWTSAALSGMFLGVAWLSGHHQAPTFITLAAAGAWLYFIFRRLRLDRRIAQAAALAALFTALAGALQILPALEYGKLAKRWVSAPEAVAWNQPVPYTVHSDYDLKGGDLLGIVYSNVRTHNSIFVGVVAFGLALIGLAAYWRDAQVRVAAGVALGGLLFALGHYSVFHGFLYSVVPALEKARTPAAASFVVCFGCAVLASFGADYVRSSAGSALTRRAGRFALVFGLLTLGVLQMLVFAGGLKYPDSDRAPVAALVALLFAAILYAGARGALTFRQAGAALLLLALFDLGNEPDSLFAHRSSDRMRWLNQIRANGDIAEYVKSQPGFQRTRIAEEDNFSPNWGAYHRVPMWGGYLASMSQNLLSFETFSREARLLYGVAYTVSAEPRPDIGYDAFTGASGLKVFREPAAFPRAWAVHRIEQVPDMKIGNDLIVKKLDSLRTSAFMLQQPPTVEACEATEEVGIKEHRPDRVLVVANLDCKGMVVVSDIYFPGWRARIDGQPTTIHEVNGAMRGVVVPPGLHTITFRYRPATVIWGAALTAAGILGALLIALLGWQRRGSSRMGA